MNFRELINKLDQITEAESTLTLQSIAAIEKDAMDKAVAEKTKGGWTGFTSWDPRSAGNIALAKLAQQNNFEGLFNSEGDFVIAYGNKTWSSNSEMHPGEKPRVTAPTSDDWKPLAAKGLVPQNAKGPAGLINWLSSGGAQKEFDAVKKQSADVAAGTGTVNAAQAPKILATDEGAKMTQLEGLVDQYLKLKADIKNNVKKDQALKVTGSKDPMDDSDDAYAHEFDPTWGGTKATGGQSVAPNAGASWDNARQIAVPGVVKESTLASTLIESFGYQKKTDLNQIISSFDYGKNRSYSNKFRNTVLREVEKAKDNLKSPDSSSDSIMSDEAIQAYLQKEFGNRDDVKGLGGDKRTWQQKNIIAKFAAGNWESITWEDDIVPGGVYTMQDLKSDLLWAAGFTLAGALAGPLFAAGAPLLAAGGFIIRLIGRIALALAKYAWTRGKPFLQLIEKDPVGAKKILSDLAKSLRDGFYKALSANFLKWQFPIQVGLTMIFKGIGDFLEKYLPEQYAQIKKAMAWVGDNVLAPAADTLDDVTGYRQKLGLKESLA
jgi:hypothetical protein